MNRSRQLASIIGILALLSGLLASAPLRAQARPLGDVLTLQSNSNSDKDTYINSGAATTNYGSSAVMRVGESNTSTDVGRALLDFNFGAIPSTATINTAKLTLWVHADLTSNARQFCVYRIKQTWVESGATWNKRDTINSWQTSGADGVNDYDSTTPLGCTTLADGLTDGTAVTWTLNPLEFQKLTDGTYTDYGFLVRADTESDDMYEFLSSDNANGGKRPRLVVDYNISTSDNDWLCVSLKGPGGSYSCTAPYDQSMSPYDVSGNGSQTGGFLLTQAKLDCTTRPGCINDRKIYYRVEFSFSWSWSSSVTATVTTRTAGIGSVNHDEVFACGTGTSGSCQGVSYGQIFTAELPTGNGAYDVSSSLVPAYSPSAAPAVNVNYRVFYSRFPFNESCSDRFTLVSNLGPFTIDPTIETPEGDPADEQLQTTIEDSVYAIQTDGGPWNNGTADKYDAALSWDGSSWTPLKDLDALCVETDPIHPELITIYITAESATVYLRSNDSAGNFDDNSTPGDEFTFTLSLAVEQLSGNCFETYLIESVIGDFLIDPTIETPVGDPTDEQVQTTVTGHLYVIQVTGGPWNDGANDHYDIAISWDGSTWDPLSEAEALCFEVDPDNSELLTIYVQAQSTSLYVRVDDAPGLFGNNTAPVDDLRYTLGVAALATGDCRNQFQYDPVDDLLAEGTIEATDYFGAVASSDLVPGQLYLIVTENGPWKENGSDRYDLQMKMFGGEYLALDYLNPEVNCSYEESDGFQIRAFAYIQPSLSTLILRVNDQDENFANNTETIDFKVFRTAAALYPTGNCGEHFRILDTVDQGIILSTKQGGVILDTTDFVTPEGGQDLVPKRYFALDIGGGPWTDFNPETVLSYSAQLQGESSWRPIDELHFFECAIRLDQYHYRVFFSPPDPNLEYRVRVNDDEGDFDENQGFLTYVLSKAETYDVYDETQAIETGTCDAYFTHAAEPLATVTIHADAASGSYIPSLAPGVLVAVQSDGGPWLDDGEGSYDLEISSNNGFGWSSLVGWPYLDCVQIEDTNYLLFYLTPTAGSLYKIRAADGDSNFGNNTGTMQLHVYAVGSEEVAIDKWSTCADGTSLQRLGVPDFKAVIDGKNFFGQQLYYPLQPGMKYAIEADGGPWTDFEYVFMNDTSERFDAAWSDDGGETWVALWEAPNIYCKEKVLGSDGVRRERIYIVAQEDSVYKIRVNDADLLIDFLTNSGQMQYILYQVSDTGVVVTASSDWLAACQFTLGRPMFQPESLVDVGAVGQYLADWIDYVRARIEYYFAWCPEHTLAISALKEAARNYEPFATIFKVLDLAVYVKNDIDSYSWTVAGQGPPDIAAGAGGGGDTPDPNKIQLMPTLDDSSPWLGGQIILQPVGGGSAASYGSCNTALAAYYSKAGGNFMPTFLKGYCTIVNFANERGWYDWIGALLWLACLTVFMRYLNYRWLDRLGF